MMHKNAVNMNIGYIHLINIHFMHHDDDNKIIIDLNDWNEMSTVIGNNILLLLLLLLKSYVHQSIDWRKKDKKQIQHIPIQMRI